MAFLLDLLIRICIDLLVATVFGTMGDFGAGVILLTVFGIEWLYPIAFELGRRGATPGKQALGLRVVMDSGLPVTPAASFTRNLLRAADFLPLAYGFGIAALLLNREFKRLGDMAAGTLVVHHKPVLLHDAPPPAPPLAPSRLLALREQAAIRAWAGRARRLTPARFEELAQLATPVLPPAVAGQSASASERLLGVAQWLMGSRR